MDAPVCHRNTDIQSVPASCADITSALNENQEPRENGAEGRAEEQDRGRGRTEGQVGQRDR